LRSFEVEYRLVKYKSSSLLNGLAEATILIYSIKGITDNRNTFLVPSDKVSESYLSLLFFDEVV